MTTHNVVAGAAKGSAVADRPAGAGSAGRLPPREPPSMALRSYMMLRLAMIGVIFALAVSVAAEVISSDGCVQRSISAYYYTPTRAVFVGALITIGTCMIVLWGKNSWEDGFLNIAGLLAPVVAFVPTSDANYCSVVTSGGIDLTDRAETSADAAEKAQATTDKLVVAAHQAIDNNVTTLGWVIGVALLALLVLAVIPNANLVPRAQTDSLWIKDVTFSVPWGFAALVWLLGVYVFNAHRAWFYENAHGWSATTMFGFITLVVITNAVVQRSAGLRPSLDAATEARHRRWTFAYAAVGVAMIVSALGIVYTGKHSSGTWFADHWVLVVEATLISLFAVFWILQTIERKDEGAPADVTGPASANA